LTSCTGSKAEPDEPVTIVSPGLVRISKDAMSNLRLSTAELSDFPDTLSVTGKISPTEDRTHVVPARASGRIEQILIASGESVVEGQPLALLWSPDYVAAREEFLQSLRQDKKMSGAGDSDNDFKSLAVLATKKLESMGLSRKDIEVLKQYAASGSESDSKSEKYLVVRAPRSGAVIAKNAILGNSVNLGDALFMIADLREVWFLGDLYPEDLTKVIKNQEVIVDTAVPGQQLHGTVSFISPIVDPTSRTIKIRALMKNPKLLLRGDMYLEGNLVISDRKAVTVPSQSILREQNAAFVFKISESKMVEGRSLGVEAQKTKVTILGERQGVVALAEGVKPGEQVVSDGALLLNAVLNNNGK
jgi:Cu(I)/Ag(I) efflux system membrane fusion protein